MKRAVMYEWQCRRVLPDVKKRRDGSEERGRKAKTLDGALLYGISVRWSATGILSYLWERRPRLIMACFEP